MPELYSQLYPVEEEPIIVKKITIENIQYLKAKNGDIYDFESREFVGTYIDGVFTKKEESDDEEEETDDESDEENIPNVIEQNAEVKYV